MRPNLISNTVDVGGGSLPPVGHNGSFRNFKEGQQLPEALLLYVVKFIEKYVKLNPGDKTARRSGNNGPTCLFQTC